MIEQQIETKQLKRAKNRFNFSNLKNSITNGAGNLVGAVGEILILDYYITAGHNVEDLQSYDFDLKIDGRRIDIKSRLVKNKPNFNCNLPAYNLKQNTEFYFFVFVANDYSRAWFAGYISKIDFLQKAAFREKGENDGGSFFFKCGTYQIKVGQLNKFNE
jgi:hypothetical protein